MIRAEKDKETKIREAVTEESDRESESAKANRVAGPLYEKRTNDYYCRYSDHSASLGVNTHLHYHIELVYMIDGECTGYINSNGYKVKSGDIFIAFPNQLHRFESVKKEKYIIFILNPDIMPELAYVFGTKCPKEPLIPACRENEELFALLCKIDEYSRGQKKYDGVIAKGYMLEFFGKLFSRMEFTESEADGSDAVKSIILYCSQNFTRDLSLDVVGKELHISKYYISHLFSHRLKTGFCDYINSLRISDACRYLREGDKKITDISETVGFPTVRTFNRVFAKQTGVTPTEYRKRYKK